MKRFFAMMLATILVFTTILLAIPSVQAETKDNRMYKDGMYDVPINVLQEIKDEKSGMAQYVKDGLGSVMIKDGKAEVTLTLTSSHIITAFQVENDGAFIDTTVVSEDEDAKERIVRFAVNDLNELMNGKVTVDTGMYPFPGIMNHAVRLQFNPSGIPLKGSETGEPGEEATKIDLADGDYTIGFDALHKTKDEKSTASGYMTNPAKLSVTNGNGKLIMTLTDNETITDFKTEQNGELVSAEVVKVNESANTRVITFDIGNLEDVINAKVSVHVVQIGYIAEPDFRIVLDKKSIKEFDSNTVEEDEEKPTKLGNGNYTINYRVLDETAFEKSVLASYIEAPAKLTLKDDEKLVTFTLTDHQAVKGFEIEQDEEFVGAEVVTVNEATNKRDIIFKIDSLDAVVNAKVKVFVEDENITKNYDVRLFFEENSVKKVDSGQTGAKYADGKYILPFDVWQEDKDEISAAGDFLETHAQLIVENGQYTVEATLKNRSWWQSFKVASGNDFVDVTEVSKDAVADTSVVRFNVQSLDEILNAKVHVIVAAINYEGKYNIRFHFDTSNLPLASGETPTPEPEQIVHAPEHIQTTIKDGKIKIESKDEETGEVKPVQIEHTQSSGGFFIIQTGSKGTPIDKEGIKLPNEKSKVVVLDNDQPYHYFEGVGLNTKPMKEWKVTFSAPLLNTEENLNHITVQDADGKQVDVKVTLSKDGETLHVLPIIAYKKGELYYMTITEVVNENGKMLKEPIRKLFIIESIS